MACVVVLCVVLSCQSVVVKRVLSCVLCCVCVVLSAADAQRVFDVPDKEAWEEDLQINSSYLDAKVCVNGIDVCSSSHHHGWVIVWLCVCIDNKTQTHSGHRKCTHTYM